MKKELPLPRTSITRKKLHNRGQIVDHAARMFMKFGYSGTSIDLIAQSLGCTKGYIYNYFDNKIEIYFAIHRKAMENALAAIEPISLETCSHADKLTAMAHAHLWLIVEETPLSRVSILGLEKHLIDANSTADRVEIRQISLLRDRYEALFRDVVQAGIDSGEFRLCDTAIVTRTLLGALNWVVVWFDPDKPRGREATRQLVQEVVSVTMNGLLRR